MIFDEGIEYIFAYKMNILKYLPRSYLSSKLLFEKMTW